MTYRSSLRMTSKSSTCFLLLCYKQNLDLYLVYAPFSVDEDEIELQTAALRKQLTDDITVPQSGVRDLKPHQVHELAQAKIAESEKLRKALGIREDYEEGSHWRRQQERSMAARDHSVDN